MPGARTVLVTGASSGIGRATAARFAARGDRVFGTSRSERPGAAGVEMLRLDVRSAESVARCVDDVLERAGRVDVLVNNAGAMHQGFAEETTVAEAQQVFATNFFGPVRVSEAVLPSMRARRAGRIVNVGSLAAWVGEPGEGCYAASKAALARYTEALHHETLHLGILVSLVEPGEFATNVVDAASVSDRRLADYDGLRENARDTIAKALAGGGDPDTVAARIVRIAGTATPRVRYGVGTEARWVPPFAVLAPQRLAGRLLRRSFGLPR